MEEAKTMKTPMSSSIKLDKDEKGKSIDSTMYRGMIGRLEPRVSFWTAFSSSHARESTALGHRANAQLSHLSRRLAERSQDPSGLGKHLPHFYIAPVGLKVYESKIWPIVPEFELREVIQRICELANAQGMGKPSVHSLTVISRVLHCMVCSILLPQEDTETRSPVMRHSSWTLF
ncbi:hypothetical protein CK203_115801 [Vitis vinifera]|uniref:Uncharacterized protein n=1 Tax=Vitis vinifera TaxID=29760 RepID=A0A438DAB1_VITVI|nr:hypothetical protein CK203_115801 [Vitis vinifera]